MKVENPTWPVSKLVKLREKIDPRPPYQRGQVWSLEKKQLLIDSLLNNYDIPKIYLNRTKKKGLYDYEVADGQQRLHALWDFVKEDGYSLAVPEEQGARWAGKTFGQLTVADKTQIEDFPIVVAVISEATAEEIRELFARLQQGVRLTPPELRNSMPSALGVMIRTLAEQHKVFGVSQIPAARYKRDDFVAHVFAIELYGQTRDIKAPDLATMYRKFRNRNSLDTKVVAKISTILDFMHEMFVDSPGYLRTKWGFVDLYGVLSAARRLPKAADAAQLYQAFESRRLKHVAKPELLIADEPSAADKRLYRYIVAFKSEGATKENLAERHEILAREILGR